MLVAFVQIDLSTHFPLNAAMATRAFVHANCDRDGAAHSPSLIKMKSGVHALMQHTDNLDDTGLRRAIENDMYRAGHRRFTAFASTVANMVAANANRQFRAIDGCRPARLGGDFTHRGGQERAIADARWFAVTVFAGSQNRGDIGSGEIRKPIARHSSQ
jgi:hypothetical protein